MQGMFRGTKKFSGDLSKWDSATFQLKAIGSDVCATMFPDKDPSTGNTYPDSKKIDKCVGT